MPESEIGSIEKAVVILQALRRLPGGGGARQLALATGIARSTVQRILVTLESSGMLLQDGASQRYSIGPQALLIGLGYRQGLGALMLARPQLHELRDLSGETAGLSVRVGNARIFIDEVQSKAPLRFSSELGKQYPVWSGANGQVLLSQTSQAEISELVTDESLVASMFRVPSPIERRERIALARERGYAVASDETIENVASVAVPVHADDGTVISALSVSGPSNRLGAARLPEILPLLLEIARKIEQLGRFL